MKNPLTLPEGFEWVTMDIEDKASMNDIYTFLRDHYVEDSEGIFRFDYPPELLKWVMGRPGFHKEWHVGLRAVKS